MENAAANADKVFFLVLILCFFIAWGVVDAIGHSGGGGKS